MKRNEKVSVCVCRSETVGCGNRWDLHVSLYLHFDVVLQLSIQEVKGDGLLEFWILWRRLDFSLRQKGISRNFKKRRKEVIL